MPTLVKALLPGQFFKLRAGAVYIARNKVEKVGDRKNRLVWRVTPGGNVQPGYVSCEHIASTTQYPGFLFNFDEPTPTHSTFLEHHKLYWHDFDTPAEIFSALSVAVGGRSIRLLYKHHPEIGHTTCFDKHPRTIMAGELYTASLVRSPAELEIWT